MLTSWWNTLYNKIRQMRHKQSKFPDWFVQFTQYATEHPASLMLSG
jgi:hypothetical protein